ncbi:hypothetical protein CSOJ01_11229 [Colletotrichum sojae]|uniref:Uncharacterized protein n=1 Tax=Colletotrichum sojae TaxID=2175907 RepID=A0A8H6MNZ3_9PEZI|nr:hypothetical protein CSOJ01_11229 [Colletotrichum sojae]
MVAAALVLLRKGEGMDVEGTGAGTERRAAHATTVAASQLEALLSCRSESRATTRTCAGEVSSGVVSRRDERTVRPRPNHNGSGGSTGSWVASPCQEKRSWRWRREDVVVVLWCCGDRSSGRRGSGGGGDL